MNKDDLRDLLDNVLELEALIQLALVRDDCSEALLRLIERKKLQLASDKPEELANALAVSETEIDMAGDIEDVTYSYEEEEPENEQVATTQEYSEEYKIDTEETEHPQPDGDRQEKEIEENPVKAKGRLVFSLNDRYRFKRELFDGSDAEFNTTLAFVASMDNYEEAEEYFIDELGWDKGNVVVAEFLEILKKYFN